MDGFDRSILDRVPLAEAVMTVLRYVWSDELLASLFEAHRGTGSEVKVTFSLLVNLVAESILEHQGSGRECFSVARDEGRLEATDAALYGKLRRLPVALSEAFLRETSTRVQSLFPEMDCDASVPASLRSYRVLVVDGKKLKNLPKRLKPLREVSGKVLAGKAVVGMILNQGLAIAMHASPDGEANDAPLTPGLIQQFESPSDPPLLVVADRQFCDLKIPNHLQDRGHFFVIRYSRKMAFSAEKEREYRDAQGRMVRDAWGTLGSMKDPRRMKLRQITLERPDGEPVVLVTNLLDDTVVSAESILEVYLERWQIERVFQELKQVLEIENLIGTSPQGAIFQFALCTCLYNVIQLVRRYIAQTHQRSPRELSSEYIERHIRKQLIAIHQFLDNSEVSNLIEPIEDFQAVRHRLTELLRDQWNPLWIKCPTTKKAPPQPKTHVKGGHSSAFKLIQASKKGS